MIKITLTILILIFCSALKAQYKYPISKTVDSTDTYFGVIYKDPYRWLEHLENKEVFDWFSAQNRFYDSVITRISLFDTLLKEQRNFYNIPVPRFTKIQRQKGGVFYDKVPSGDYITKVFYRSLSDTSEREILNPISIMLAFFDTPHNLADWQASDDSKIIALSLSNQGRDYGMIRFFNAENKSFFRDSISNAKFISWFPNSDNQFFYQQYNNSDEHDTSSRLNSKFMFYNNGEVIELMSKKHTPRLNFTSAEDPFINYDEFGDFMLASKGSVDNNQEVYYASKNELLNKEINWKPLCKRADKIIKFVCRGNAIYVLSSKNNPNRDLLKYTITNGILQCPHILYKAQRENLTDIRLSKSFLLLEGNINGTKSINKKIEILNDRISDIKIPLDGISSFAFSSEISDTCQISNSNWARPSSVYDLDLKNNRPFENHFFEKSNIKGLDEIETKEIKIKSYDNEEVPLSLVYKKSFLKKDGNNICYLKGYGAYGISYPAIFDLSDLSLLNRGVILAYAHVRGGGEKGEMWHLAGLKTTKPNTWKDFIACAKYLIKNNYTSNSKLAITGRSAGGILIGRSVTERPDLFKAAIIRVGCLNPMRLEFSPNGPTNIPEFGSVKIKSEAKALAEMDAVLHVKKGVKYPAMIISTGFNDPRVISWCPGKFAAAVQNSNSSLHPILLQVDFYGGHSAESADQMSIESASEDAFILWKCGYKGK